MYATMSFGASADSLVSTVISSLRSASGSSAEYQNLASQLYTLESALLLINDIELDGDQSAEATALRQAVAQCLGTMETFGEKIVKYQSSQRLGGSGNKAKDASKAEWPIIEKAGLAMLGADLTQHTTAINLLLSRLYS